jgi:uncharacterized membrane protein required for colicin V production
VPQIDTPLLLDILLGLVVLLFVPFGIRRGVAKEAMVSAGILLGASLADRFAAGWASELSTRFNLEQGSASFAAAAALLFASTFLLGYGAGAALGRARPGTLSRLAGGLLAAFNAALLLSYLLAWIDQYLQQGGALDDGIVSTALLQQADTLLLAAAGVLLGLTVIGWIINATRSRRQPRAPDGSSMAGVPARQRPVRVAPAADAGKYDPGIEASPRSGRFGPGFEATSPLPVASSLGERAPWYGDGQTVPVNGNGRDARLNGSRTGHTEAATSSTDETVWSAWSHPAPEESFARSEPVAQWPVTQSLGVTDDERCAVCRARVGPRDVFCPECGATL